MQKRTRLDTAAANTIRRRERERVRGFSAVDLTSYRRMNIALFLHSIVFCVHSQALRSRACTAFLKRLECRCSVLSLARVPRQPHSSHRVRTRARTRARPLAVRDASAAVWRHPTTAHWTRHATFACIRQQLHFAIVQMISNRLGKKKMRRFCFSIFVLLVIQMKF